MPIMSDHACVTERWLGLAYCLDYIITLNCSARHIMRLSPANTDTSEQNVFFHERNRIHGLPVCEDIRIGI